MKKVRFNYEEVSILHEIYRRIDVEEYRNVFVWTEKLFFSSDRKGTFITKWVRNDEWQINWRIIYENFRIWRPCNTLIES